MEREITNDDMRSAIRGLGMYGMSSDELVSLANYHEMVANADGYFASRVIARAARQVAAFKQWECVPT